MILHPGILALLLGSLMVLVLVLVAARVALQILAGWNPASADERQLRLERRTSLVSVLVNYALAFSILSLPLFLYTLDSLHPLFVGAMCATGSLNANPIGWTALFVKLLLALLAALWVVINHYDLQAEDFPLVRFKSLALLLLLPLVAADLYLQLRYFLGLNPEIITSCCGSLFSSNAGGVAAEVSGLPPRPMMIALYGGAAIYAALILGSLGRPWPFLRWLLALTAALFLLTGLAGAVSFISLYVYEIPTHHCPFDMLQASSNFIGYPLFLFLFGACFCGLVPAVLQSMRRKPSLGAVTARAERRWLGAALIFLGLFLLVSTWAVLASRLSLAAYF